MNANDIGDPGSSEDEEENDEKDAWRWIIVERSSAATIPQESRSNQEMEKEDETNSDQDDVESSDTVACIGKGN